MFSITDKTVIPSHSPWSILSASATPRECTSRPMALLSCARSVTSNTWNSQVNNPVSGRGGGRGKEGGRERRKGVRGGTGLRRGRIRV